MASKYLQKYQVPEGFYDILHEFSREVLRAQPEDIIEYAAHYFEHKAQGKEYYYESKYNIQKPTDKYDIDNQKQYNPTPHQNYTDQAKKVVQSSNQRVEAHQQSHSGSHTPNQSQQTQANQTHQQQNGSNAAQHQHQRQQSNQSGGARPHTQNSITSEKPNDTSKLSQKSKRSDLSHPEEKKISKEFVGDLYNSALHKAMNPSHQQEERAYEQAEEGQEEEQQNFGYEEGEGQEEGQFDPDQQQQYYSGEGEEGEYNQQGQEQQDAELDQDNQQEQQYQGQEGEQEQEEEVVVQQQEESKPQKEEIVLDGPVEEYENVALKIQSAFRGNKVRKEKK